MAGGRARRFKGQDKGSIILNGKRLIDHVHDRLTQQVDSIWISGNHDYGLGLNLVPDHENELKGPLAGLYAVYKRFENRPQIEGVLVVPVDGPFLPLNLYERLYSAGSSAVAFSGDRLHPTFGYWHLEDLESFFTDRRFIEKNSLTFLAEITGAKAVKFADPKGFANINCEQDLSRFS